MWQVWANNKDSDETGNKFDPKSGTHAWGGKESHYLYVRDPDNARLALTLMDENKVSDDEMLGACTVIMQVRWFRKYKEPKNVPSRRIRSQALSLHPQHQRVHESQ